MSRLDGAAQANIPQVASRLAPRSPDFVHRTSVFRPERCLGSRERLELGASDRKSAVLCPGGGGFRRSGQTCPMAFVHLGTRSDHTLVLRAKSGELDVRRQVTWRVLIIIYYAEPDPNI